MNVTTNETKKTVKSAFNDEFENYLNGRPTSYEITPEKLAKMA